MENINTDNKVVDITKVVPNQYNPKLNIDDSESNKAEFEKIKASLQIAGQILPVIVRELDNGTYEIINGYHRHRALTELGYTKIEIKNLGKIDFDTAVSRALLTEDTKVPIDSIELGHLMKKIVTPEKPAEYWATLLPYTPELIAQKVEMIDFDESMFNDNGINDSHDSDSKGHIYKFVVTDEQGIEDVQNAMEKAGGDGVDSFLAICRYYTNN